MDQDYWSATITLEASYHQPPGHQLWIWLKKEMKHRSPSDISRTLSGMSARQQVPTVTRLRHYIPSTQVALARTKPSGTWAMFSKSFQSRGRTGQDNEDPRVNYLRDGQRVLWDHREGAVQSPRQTKVASSRANQSAEFPHQEAAGHKGEGNWASCRGRNKGLWKLAAKWKRHGREAKRNCISCAAHVQFTPHSLWRDDHWEPVTILFMSFGILSHMWQTPMLALLIILMTSDTNIMLPMCQAFF